jgi:hypothetical protein
MSTGNDGITRELCDERMTHINTSLKNIEAHVECLPDLKNKVDDHEQFISGFKRIGMRILVILALCGVAGVSVYAVIVENLHKLP